MPSTLVPLNSASQLISAARSAADVFTICWTSGTEAEPKGVPRTNDLWTAIAYATTDAAKLRDGDVLLCPFPIVNMSGIGGMLVPWLQTGGTLVLHQPMALPVFMQQIVMEKVNYTVAPPVLLNLLLAKPEMLANVDLSSLRTIGSGSAPLGRTKSRPVASAFGQSNAEGEARLLPPAGEDGRRMYAANQTLSGAI